MSVGVLDYPEKNFVDNRHAYNKQTLSYYLIFELYKRKGRNSTDKIVFTIVKDFWKKDRSKSDLETGIPSFRRHTKALCTD